VGGEGQGGVGGTESVVCSGGGLVFVGPATSVDTTIGPTIISPGFAGVVVVSGGPASVGP
jgi:hypothetical protein